MKNIGLIGCGNIAETYFRAQDYFNNINFIACADKFAEVSDKCAKQYNIKSLSVDEILNDSNIDVILNLTIPQAHFEVSKLALEAGAIIHYDTRKNPQECNIIAAGPKDSSAIAFGEIFYTDHPNHVTLQLNDKLAPGAYSYLIIIEFDEIFQEL